MDDKSSQLPARHKHRLDARVYCTTKYEYYFTICARHQGHPFDDQVLADEVVASLLWTRATYEWKLFCYCLMPNHLHFVCRLTDRDLATMNGGARGEVTIGVLEHLARFKSYTTRQAWRRGVIGQLWQKSSYDRVLDLERPFEEVVEYVLRNPVRRGLAADWSDWPYSKIVDKW
jgi:REP element-mobilizing transposase RayT